MKKKHAIIARPVRAIKNAVENNGGAITVRNAMNLGQQWSLPRHVSIDRMLGGLPNHELQRIARAVGVVA